jgi:hypothetical protein
MGNEEESRLIAKNYVGAQPSGFFLMRGHSCRFHRSTSGSSLLDGAPFRFLMTPVEAMHQTSNVMGVVVHAELLGDELGDTRLGPEIGAVAARHRTLEK